MSLRIPFDPAGLDAKTVAAFDDLIAGLQTWANNFDLGNNNVKVSGLGTFAGQHRARLLLNAAQTIPDSTDTFMSWRTPGNTAPTATEEYDTATIYDGSRYIVPTEPGLYLSIASVAWTANAVGTRIAYLFQSGFGISSEIARHRMAGHATITLVQQLAMLVPVTEITSPPAKFGIEVFQSSGGNLDVVKSDATWWLFCKIG